MFTGPGSSRMLITGQPIRGRRSLAGRRPETGRGFVVSFVTQVDRRTREKRTNSTAGFPEDKDGRSRSKRLTDLCSEQDTSVCPLYRRARLGVLTAGAHQSDANLVKPSLSSDSYASSAAEEWALGQSRPSPCVIGADWPSASSHASSVAGQNARRPFAELNTRASDGNEWGGLESETVVSEDVDW